MAELQRIYTVPFPDSEQLNSLKQRLYDQAKDGDRQAAADLLILYDQPIQTGVLSYLRKLSVVQPVKDRVCARFVKEIRNTAEEDPDLYAARLIYEESVLEMEQYVFGSIKNRRVRLS